MAYFIAVLLLVITAVQGLPGGAPPEACGITTDIEPDHGASPSDTPLPYSVDLSDFTGGQYIPEDIYISNKKLYIIFISINMYGDLAGTRDGEGMKLGWQ